MGPFIGFYLLLQFPYHLLAVRKAKHMSAHPQQSARLGALCALIAVTCFSVNDVSIKFLSGGYPLHEVVLIRSVIGLLTMFLIVLPFAGGFGALRTRRLGMHVLRGLVVVLANSLFFLGLAALEIADAVAIFFISPLVITLFSILFLGETVGPRRWFAIVLGFVGVMIVMRPGTEAFQFASILPMLAAVAYATLHIMTRKMGGTESAATMAIYIQMTFIVSSSLVGLTFGDGAYNTGEDVSLTFLLRAWVWPEPSDIWVLVAVGLASSFGGFFISQAYRVSEAAFVAPFEYIAMPMAVIWGIVIFDEFPDAIALFGIALIIGSGLYMVWRDVRASRVKEHRPKLRR